MSEVVNLRLARKRRARAEVEAQATTNRAAFGRTKEERARDRGDRERRDRHLDGARLTPSANPPAPFDQR